MQLIESIPFKSTQPPPGSKIVKAAIVLGDKVYLGWRHGDIIFNLAQSNLIKKASDPSDLPVVHLDSQGFVDADGNFYNRYQSTRIALHNRQVKTLKELTSEDLWDFEGNPIKPKEDTTVIIKRRRFFSNKT